MKKMRVVGIAEIAAMFGVSGQAVYNWIKRYPDFPKPLAELHMGRIFDEVEIRAWGDDNVVHGRRTK